MIMAFGQRTCFVTFSQRPPILPERLSVGRERHLASFDRDGHSAGRKQDFMNRGIPNIDLIVTRSASSDVTHFDTKIRPKAVLHRSLGHRPRNVNRNESVWPKAIIIFDASDA
jgi:hypothetical protein